MENLLVEIRQIVASAQIRVARSVNHALTVTYWHIGQAIVEEEQRGNERAEYGKELVKGLSKQLQMEFGSGFAAQSLWNMRLLFLNFPMLSALRRELTWTHYKSLIRLDDPSKREFYIAEATKNAWSVRQLERQIHSLLYERLLMSQDKESVLTIARGEAQPTDPTQIIKDPTVLEFLGLKPQAAYYEKNLEAAIITHLQEFLLELGNGFSFVARQKRLILGDDEFKVDLVFYNRLLQCFVLLDIKIDKITHQDLGQLQMYVNVFDRDIKADFENPTIGILLCADKNDIVVRYSLPGDNRQIFASKYQLHLPSEQQLLEEVRKEFKRFNQDDIQ